MKALYFVLVAGIFLAACDSVTEDATDIPIGNYVEFGVRQLQNGEVVSEGLAGVYFQRVFQFDVDGTFEVEVYSDLAPEEGTARGRYEIGNGLRLRVESSTSSYYSVGDVVAYDNVEVVDGAYRLEFGGNAAVFRGPGLVLSAEREDTDGQKDVTETYLRGPVSDH